MGCDIHMMLEINTDTDEYGEAVWEQGRGLFPDAFWIGRLRENPEDGAAQSYAYRLNEPYGGRNYTLFGFLGDVRNGRGFAGIDIGDRLDPFDGGPRGVPVDASPEWSQEVVSWDVDMHSQSWALVSELEDHPGWDQPVTKRGYISEEAYIAGDWPDGGPQEYSGMISGPAIDTMTSTEYGRRTEPTEEGRQVYVQVEWTTPLRDSCTEFLDMLETLKAFGPTDRLRLVYGFDN